MFLVTLEVVLDGFLGVLFDYFMEVSLHVSNDESGLIDLFEIRLESNHIFFTISVV